MLLEPCDHDIWRQRADQASVYRDMEVPASLAVLQHDGPEFPHHDFRPLARQFHQQLLGILLKEQLAACQGDHGHPCNASRFVLDQRLQNLGPLVWLMPRINGSQLEETPDEDADVWVLQRWLRGLRLLMVEPGGGTALVALPDDG
jgi:hypothetical protein